MLAVKSVVVHAIVQHSSLFLYNLKSNWNGLHSFRENRFTNDNVTIAVCYCPPIASRPIVTRKPVDVVHGWYMGHHHNTCHQCNLSSHTLYNTPLSHLSHVALFQADQLSLPGGVPTVPAVSRLPELDRKRLEYRRTNSQNASFSPGERCSWLMI